MMKLYCLVHKSVVDARRQQPLTGCSFFNNSPYLYAFDSGASACLESALYKTLKEIPPHFELMVYLGPSDSVFRPELRIGEIYGNHKIENRYLGNWVDQFLKNNTALVAEFPSKNWSWAGVKNYIINPGHERFGEVEEGRRFKPIAKDGLLSKCSEIV